MRIFRVSDLGGALHSKSDCPLCPSNGKVNIVAVTGAAYLVEAKASPIEGCHLIVPTEHITDVARLPSTWQACVHGLLVMLPWDVRSTPFNLSMNLGPAAGQTLPHLHLWVIPRVEEPTKLSYAKGTATLIKELNDVSVTT